MSLEIRNVKEKCNREITSIHNICNHLGNGSDSPQFQISSTVFLRRRVGPYKNFIVSGSAYFKHKNILNFTEKLLQK